MPIAMPALNFQSRFVPLVESGKKRQTIRAFRKDERDPEPGDTLYLYTGMRTKKCRKLRTARCKSAEWILIGRASIQVRREFRAHWVKLNRFARADGFRNWPEMRHWFFRVHGVPFSGLLIKW